VTTATSTAHPLAQERWDQLISDFYNAKTDEFNPTKVLFPVLAAQ
jgi:hypothetical protein